MIRNKELRYVTGRQDTGKELKCAVCKECEVRPVGMPL